MSQGVGRRRRKPESREGRRCAGSRGSRGCCATLRSWAALTESFGCFQNAVRRLRNRHRLAFEKVGDVRDQNAWRAGLPIRLHFLRSGRPGLGPSNLFADATPITGCIDARGYIGIDRQRRTMIDRGSDFRASNDVTRSVVKTGTLNARGLGASWYVRRTAVSESPEELLVAAE